MKVTFDDRALTDLDGNDLKLAEDKSLTLKGAVSMALTAGLPGDDALEFGKKVELYKLAKRVKKGGELDIKAEDIVVIKQRVAKQFNALVAGQVSEAIEGEDA